MHVHPGQTMSALVIGTVAVLGALALLLAVEPGAEPVVLLVGFLFCAFLYGAMYLYQRRRHW